MTTSGVIGAKKVSRKSAMRNDEVQALYNMIAILTERLGGTSEFTFDELENPPTAELIRNVQDAKITIKIIKDDGNGIE